ncbi:MAG: hypothetical protein DLM68_06200 [Hyphomicrobiales bacterium]|nr:MAG: hypothetical protein DLM68_06200 [Hyphomicrobiales bacterium]
MERKILKKAALIADQRETFAVRVIGDVPCVSPSGYCAWRGRPERPRKAANRALLTEIRRVHAAHRGRGHRASRSRAERLMRHEGIRAGALRRFRACPALREIIAKVRRGATGS